MAIPFKFTDRWPTSLRKVVPEAMGNEAGLLELRDRALEDHLTSVGLGCRAGAVADIGEATAELAGSSYFTTDSGLLYTCVATDSPPTTYTWKVMDPGANTYTPTFTGLVIGTGGAAFNSARFWISHGKIEVWGRGTFGAAGVTFPGANVNLTLPYGASVDFVDANSPVGEVTFQIAAGGAVTQGLCWVNSATTVRILSDNAAVANLTPAALGAAVPAAWAAGDTFRYHFSVPVSI